MLTGRDRIQILESKPGVVWMIVCDLDADAANADGNPKYSHHWTGHFWQLSDGDNAHIYTRSSVAEQYLQEELFMMLWKLPRRRPSATYMIAGILVGGIAGYFIAGGEGRAVGGGIGATLGLIVGGLIGRRGMS